MYSAIKKYYGESKWDTYQSLFTAAIDHYCCAWTFLVFILIGKKWKNTIIYIIIIHYALRYIGKVVETLSEFRENKYPGYNYEYRSNEAYIWGHATSRVILYISEVIGDWYLLVRTKAIVKSNKKIRWVFVTCIIYNIARLSKIYFNFTYIPFKENFDPKADELDFFLRKVEYKKNKWICDLILHTTSIVYDLAVIITLKRNVFIKYENVTHGKTKGNFFIAKFQRLSVYRIYWTVILSICFSPLIFMFCITLLYGLNYINTLKDSDKIQFYKNYCNDRDIENIRINIMNVSYILIYVDQIMLRYYARQNKITIMQASSNSIIRNNSTNHLSGNYGNRLYNFSKVYHETNKQFEDIDSQKLINYKNNDNVNVNYNNKSFDLNNNSESTIKYDNSANKNNSRINYYDINNNNKVNNDNNGTMNYYNNINNPQWKKYYNSLNQNNY